MANGLSLDSVLAELNKTASAEAPKAEKATTKKVAQAKTELLDALKRVEASTANEKTAAVAPAPAAELQKIAADLAAADQEAIIKEAHVYGAAVADGFIARLGQYDAAAGSVEKTAAAVDVEKIAEEAVRGYIETDRQIKTAAQAEFQRGYQETVAEIEKVATDCYGQGVQDCQTVLAQLAK